MKAIRSISIVVATSFLAGCGQRESASPPSQETKPSPSSAPATPATPSAPDSPAPSGATGSATITGKIVFKGTPPKLPMINFAADAACAAMHPTPVPVESVVVNADGTLQNVFVYVKEGRDLRRPPPKTPVVLNQAGCMYRPHVLGIQVGQPLDILNSDSTLHNVHALPNSNAQFNVGQPVAGMKTTKRFTAPEIMVKFKCDVHPWMIAYVGVLDHPYFSVSGTNGTFSIGSLPAGTYLIAAWHEKYGTQEQSVTVADQETKEISFEFKEP